MRRIAAFAALAVLAVPAFGAAAAADNAVVDVRVGEKGALLRVAVLCRNACEIVPRAAGVWFLPGVASSLAVDLARRSRHATGVVFTPAEGGSIVKIFSKTAPASAAARPCALDGEIAACIDLAFSAAERDAARPAPIVRFAAREEGAREAPAPVVRVAMREHVETQPKRPAFRDPKIGEARFAPPERFEPPKFVPRQPPEEARIVPATALAPTARPILRADRAASLAAPSVDIPRAAYDILGRRLGVAECESAQARLRGDAWALDAMVDVGFCAAAAGRLDEADGVFVRLLDYTPDNYAALVGRALVAAKSGDRSIARKYFQDALNVPPPMEESSRIVAAMSGL